VRLEEGLTLWGAAHLTPAGTGNLLSGFRVAGRGLHLALFHGSEIGNFASLENQSPHAPFTEADLRSAGFHHALLGHWHQPRATVYHTYPGNPEPLTFGEQGERGAVMLSIDQTGAIQREHHQVSVGQLHDLNLDISGCQSGQDLRELVQSQLQGRSGVARVTLQGELPVEVDFAPSDLADAAPWMDMVLPRLRFSTAYDLEQLASEPTVRGHFVRAVQAAELSEETRQRVLTTGLRALAGRKDLTDVF
ncbi:MAG: metallophosphoesterase family protein, partial [Candidatus Dormibacteraceae bacterium]